MFDAKGKNSGLAKFNRGFRRLLVIMRFVKMIGDEIDPHLMDIGSHTLFSVRGRQLQFEGMNLNDFQDYLEYQIVGRLKNENFIPDDVIEQIKSVTNLIRNES